MDIMSTLTFILQSIPADAYIAGVVMLTLAILGLVFKARPEAKQVVVSVEDYIAVAVDAAVHMAELTNYKGNAKLSFALTTVKSELLKQGIDITHPERVTRERLVEDIEASVTRHLSKKAA